jgi:hypothetical protein
MSFSNVGPYPVLDENACNALASYVRTTPGMGGLAPRDFGAYPLGHYCAVSANSLIPRTEWAERIEALEVARATPEHVCTWAKVPILNQGQLPYCWAYGTVGVMMASYAAAGLPVPHLSATSLAAKIQNYQKRGGWAGMAIEGNQKYGVSTLDFWPEAVADPRYDTAEQRENASLHRAAEWLELAPNSFDAIASELLRGRAVTAALPWWGHLVYYTKLVRDSRGYYGALIRNSWDYSWENGGKAILMEAKATPAEAFIIRSVTKYTPKAA